jgi:hypothetical protein
MEGEFLMKSILQILAIARAEFRFSFRRSAPVIVTALIGLLVSAGMMLTPLVNLPALASKSTLTSDEVAAHLRVAMGDISVFGIGMAGPLMLLALFLLPIATIATIPADRTFGVLELLVSTPLTGLRYLIGKILGVLTAVLTTAAVMLGLFLTLLNTILFGVLHYGLSWNAILFYLEFSLLDGLPLLAWGTVTSVLIGVFFLTRRDAILPGILAGILSIFFWGSVFKAHSLIIPLTDVATYYLLQKYFSAAQAIESSSRGQEINPLWQGTTHIGFGQIALMDLAILAIFLLLGGFARLWLQWKENF